MPLSDLPSFNQLSQKLQVLAARQKLLAQNLANVNTPNQKAQDIDPKILSGSGSPFLKQLNLKKTSEKHIANVGNSQNPSGDVKVTTSKEKLDTTIQGNNISLEDQLQKVEETRLAHQVATMLYRKNHDLLRNASKFLK